MKSPKPRDRIIRALNRLVADGAAMKASFEKSTHFADALAHKGEDTAAYLKAAEGATEMLAQVGDADEATFNEYRDSMTESMLSHLTLRLPTHTYQRVDWEAHRLIYKALTDLFA